MPSQLLRKKGIDDLIRASEDPAKRLRKTLGPWSLTALGIGAVIGSGIFTVIGTAATGKEVAGILKVPLIDLLFFHSTTVGRPGAGPAITLSFILVAIACGFAGLCYAELASMIPISGSAYTYAYATLGEIFAWIIGWDLILEYAVSNMSVAVGFSAYLQDLFDNLFGFRLPPSLAFPPFPAPGGPVGVFNVPALLITMAVTWLLVRGVKESAGANTGMVLIKLAAIVIFCLGAARAIDTSNWHPFAPHGFRGILTGASIVFFSYIGFDSVSTAAEECRRPQRDLPIGILATLAICTVAYCSVSLVLTGIVNWKTLDADAPVAKALEVLHFNRLRLWVTAGALMGMLSSLLVYQYGQARIWFAMSRDRLLPKMFSAVHQTYRTPYISTWIAGFVVGVPAGIWDIDTFAELSNIGTLFAFILVSAGVIVLRRTDPDRKRSFRVPLVPWVPGFSIVCCLLLMAGLPLETWIRFFVWLIIGLFIYFVWSRKQSELKDRSQADPGTTQLATSDDGQFLSSYLRVLVESPEALNTSIHSNDEMYVFTERAFRGQRNQALCSYFGTGKQIYDAIRQIVDWKFGGFRNVSSFLDFAAGYGRSTRFIARDLSPERLWVSEISRAALRFQEGEFGVHGLPSQTNPDEFVCDRRFDCIAVVSLFTHLPERTFVPWLRRLYGLLENGGCLIFSTHGPTVKPNVKIPDSGLRFEEQSEIDTLSKQDYGSTFVTERFVRQAIREATSGEGVCHYLPQGLCRFQDLYVVTQSHAPAADLRYSSGPHGRLDGCARVKANQIRINGWAADAAQVPTVQVFLDGTLLQACTPSESRPDVKARYAGLASAGFSCACSAPDRHRLSGSEELTIKAIGDKGLESILYHDTIANARSYRSRR